MKAAKHRLAVRVGAAALVLLILWRTDNPRLDRARMTLIDGATPSMRWVTMMWDSIFTSPKGAR